MIDTILDKLARLFFDREMRETAEKTVEQQDRDAGIQTAARYTRGNVAIQQKRVDIRKLAS